MWQVRSLCVVTHELDPSMAAVWWFVDYDAAYRFLMSDAWYAESAELKWVEGA